MKALFSRAVLAFILFALFLVSGFQNCASSFRSTTQPIKTPGASVKDPWATGSEDGGGSDNDGGNGFPGYDGDDDNNTGGDKCAASTRSFNVIATTTSNAVYNYSASYKMDALCSDIEKDKYAFIMAKVNNVNHLYNPSSRTWTPLSSITSYNSYALQLPKTENQYPFTFFNFSSVDLVELGGSELFAGYGVGSNVSAAVNEMLAYRDTSHPNGRYNRVMQVPSQETSIAIVTNGTAESNFTATATVLVRQADYNKEGYFFIAARTPEPPVGTANPPPPTWFLYDGTTWTEYTPGVIKTVGAKQALKNKTLSLSYNAKTKDVAGWWLYAGYGASETLSTAFAAFETNSQRTRNQNQYIISTSALDENNWRVQHNVISSALKDFTVTARTTVATAHKDLKGYVLMAALLGDNAWVLKPGNPRDPNNPFDPNDPNRSMWILWDGKMEGFGAPYKLSEKSDQTIYMVKNSDITSLGGAKVLVGYGVGDNIIAAVEECLGKVRYNEIITVEKQLFSASITVPQTYDVNSTVVNLNVSINIYPDYLDYDKTDYYYYLAAVSPDGTQLFAFSSALGGWVLYDSTKPEQMYMNKPSPDLLKNYSKTFQFSGKDLALYKGFTLFTGYGTTVQDMIDRKHMNQTGVVVK